MDSAINLKARAETGATGGKLGLTNAGVNFDKRQATVTYDDARTSVEALTKATRDAGYPATVKQ